MLILIDTIDVSDCFFIQNSEPVELGLQGVHFQILAKVQTKPVRFVTACMNASTSRLSDLPPALHIVFLASLKLLVKRYRW